MSTINWSSFHEARMRASKLYHSEDDDGSDNTDIDGDHLVSEEKEDNVSDDWNGRRSPVSKLNELASRRSSPNDEDDTPSRHIVDSSFIGKVQKRLDFFDCNSSPIGITDQPHIAELIVPKACSNNEVARPPYTSRFRRNGEGKKVRKTRGWDCLEKERALQSVRSVIASESVVPTAILGSMGAKGSCFINERAMKCTPAKMCPSLSTQHACKTYAKKLVIEDGISLQFFSGKKQCVRK